MAAYLPATLRQRLIAADDHRCAYCHTPEVNCGIPMVVDHWLARSKGGPTEFSNLCFACYRCNLFKGTRHEAVDPLSGEVVRLFHPRLDRWVEHFAWDEAGLHIIGLTSLGRATVAALNMNNPVIVEARRNWIRLGWRPDAE